MLDVAACSYRSVDLPYRYNVAPRKVQKSCEQLRGKKWIRTLHLFDAFLTFPKTFAIHAGNRQREKEKDDNDDDSDDDDPDDYDSDDERESGVEKKTTTKSGFCRL